MFVRKLEVSGKEFYHQTKTKNEIKTFFEEVVKCYKAEFFTIFATILNSIDFLGLTNEQCFFKKLNSWRNNYSALGDLCLTRWNDE